MLGKIGGKQDEYPDFFLQSWGSAGSWHMFFIRDVSSRLDLLSLELLYWRCDKCERELSSFSTFLFSHQFLIQMKITNLLKLASIKPSSSSFPSS